MTNKRLFKSAMDKAGFTQQTLADAIGIGLATLNMKINNVRQFKTSEIVALKRILNLSNEERDAIFFADNAD